MNYLFNVGKSVADYGKALYKTDKVLARDLNFVGERMTELAEDFYFGVTAKKVDIVSTQTLSQAELLRQEK